MVVLKHASEDSDGKGKKRKSYNSRKFDYVQTTGSNDTTLHKLTHARFIGF